MEKTLVILGTARSDSNTQKAVVKFFPNTAYELVDLRDLRIQLYDYNHAKNADDDFLGIAKKMQSADVIVFATPVYWYSMSALLKIFIDRFSELLSTHKTIGKSLQGKKVFLVASGSDPALPDGFEVPFQLTCKYFDMSYQSAYYASAAEIK